MLGGIGFGLSIVYVISEAGEERADVRDEQPGLLEGREVPAARHRRRVGDVVAGLRARLRGARRVSRGKAATPVGSSTPAGGAEAAVDALPVQPGRGRPGAGDPVEHHVVEQLVAAERVLGMPVAVRPGPELLHDPGGLAGGRVRQPVAQGLRPCRLLFRRSRNPICA